MKLYQVKLKLENGGFVEIGIFESERLANSILQNISNNGAEAVLKTVDVFTEMSAEQVKPTRTRKRKALGPTVVANKFPSISETVDHHQV